MKKKSLFTKLSITILSLVFLVIQPAAIIFAQTPESNNKEFEQFDFANGLFERGLYSMALSEYTEYTTTYKQGQYFEDALFGLSESLFFKEDYKDAIPSYLEFTSNYPESKKLQIAFIRLGQSNFYLNEFERAIATFNKVKVDQLNDVLKQTLYYFTARAYYLFKNQDEALKHFSLATNLQNQKRYLAHSYLSIGDIYIEQKTFNKAKENYTLGFNATDSEELKSLALFKKGESEFKAELYKEAAKSFLRCTKDFKHLKIADDAFLNLITTYFNDNQYQSVIDEFSEYEKKKEKKIDVFDVYYLAAISLVKTSQYDRALVVLETSLNLNTLTEQEKTKAFIKKAKTDFG